MSKAPGKTGPRLLVKYYQEVSNKYKQPNLFQKIGWVTTPLANGVGRYVPQCMRLTLKFCKIYGSSHGVREFIANDLVDFVKTIPGTVVYVKPRRHRSPVVVAEYLNGHREWVSFHDFSRDDCAKYLKHLKDSAGYGDIQFKQYWHTDTPSIQGVWNPFVNKSQQLAFDTFPTDSLSNPELPEESASEILLEQYGKLVRDVDLKNETTDSSAPKS